MTEHACPRRAAVCCTIALFCCLLAPLYAVTIYFSLSGVDPMMRQQVRVCSTGETGYVMGRASLCNGAGYWLVSPTSDPARALEGRLVDMADVELAERPGPVEGADVRFEAGYFGER